MVTKIKKTTVLLKVMMTQPAKKCSLEMETTTPDHIASPFSPYDTHHVLKRMLTLATPHFFHQDNRPSRPLHCHHNQEDRDHSKGGIRGRQEREFLGGRVSGATLLLAPDSPESRPGFSRGKLPVPCRRMRHLTDMSLHQRKGLASHKCNVSRFSRGKEVLPWQLAALLAEDGKPNMWNHRSILLLGST